MPDLRLPVTGDPDADRLLDRDPFAVMIGMLLDQQIAIELAFKGPHRLHERIGDYTPASLADHDPEDLLAAFQQTPALHRFPASMARRAQALAQALVVDHHGDAAAVWRDAADGRAALRRLKALPGFGPEKSKIMLAVRGKRFGDAPDGWQAASAPFSDAQPRSVADVDSPEGLARVRAWKTAQRAAGRAKDE